MSGVFKSACVAWFLTLDLLCRMRADRSLLDSPITPAWSLASHHSTSLSTSFALVPSWSAASAEPTHTHTRRFNVIYSSVHCHSSPVKAHDFYQIITRCILLIIWFGFFFIDKAQQQLTEPHLVPTLIIKTFCAWNHLSTVRPCAAVTIYECLHDSELKLLRSGLLSS